MTVLVPERGRGGPPAAAGGGRPRAAGWATEHIHIVRETTGAEAPEASDNETAGVA